MRRIVVALVVLALSWLVAATPAKSHFARVGEPTLVSVSEGERRARAMCDDYDTQFFAEPQRAKRIAALKEVNSRQGRPISARGIMDKIRVWKDPLGVKGAEETVRILCLTYTYVAKHVNAATSYQLWGRKCDHHIIFTNEIDTVINRTVPAESIVRLEVPGGESYQNMWQKTRSIIQYLERWERTAEFDFFLLGGDDTFVITENLRKMLLESDIQHLNANGVPLFMGYRQRSTTKITFLSGAGYIMNYQLLSTLFSIIHTAQCAPHYKTFAEDVTIAACLKAYGIYPHDTSNEFGEDRVVIMTPVHMSMIVNDPRASWWFPSYRQRPMPQGLDIVARYTVLFHFCGPMDQERLYTALYDGKNTW